MTSPSKALESAAVRAHRRGACWAEFWSAYEHQVRAAEPYHRGRYRRLVNRLLALVTSGDCDGMEPAGEPWLLDEAQVQPEPASPHDTRTAAKLQLSFPAWPMPEPVGEASR